MVCYINLTFYFTEGFEKEEPSIKTREKILSLIKENPKITAKELAEKLELSVKSIEWQIKSLKDSNIIERVCSKKDGYWKILS